MEKICENCKEWEQMGSSRFGYCDIIARWIEQDGWGLNNDPDYIKTHARFGCIYFEEKKDV